MARSSCWLRWREPARCQRGVQSRWSPLRREEIEATQREVRRILDELGYQEPLRARALARIDHIVMHPVAGPLLLLAVLFLMFQAVFSWAALPAGPDQQWRWRSRPVADRGAWREGPLRSLLVDGVVGGVGSGARVPAADPDSVLLHPDAGGQRLSAARSLPARPAHGSRWACRVGLSSRCCRSFACAIPGIMAARTIPNMRDRLATILLAPLMTCSARLPVYALVIGAFIPARNIGIFNLQGLVLFALYAAGVMPRWPWPSS